MIQNIIALTIVGAVLLKTVYSVYVALTTKDKSLCGGCASCDLKHELKMKGKLTSQIENKEARTFQFTASNLKYSGKTEI